MNTETTTSPQRQAAIRALAVVGFIALLFIGMTLAVFTARYIPTAVSRIGQAAVSLSSVFTPAKPGAVEVVNTGTVLPFGTTSTTTATTTATSAATTTTTTTSTYPTGALTAGTATENAYVIPGATGNASVPNTNPASFYGLPDLTVTNLVVGYLPLNSSADSDFVASQTVPSGTRFAVKFTVTNIGTNTSGNWDFSANLPTKQSYTFYAPSQQALTPGDKIDFMLHLDAGEAKTGNQTASITLDPSRLVNESNKSNNFGSTSVTIN
jgi:hypothetical protein